MAEEGNDLKELSTLLYGSPIHLGMGMDRCS